MTGQRYTTAAVPGGWIVGFHNTHGELVAVSEHPSGATASAEAATLNRLHQHDMERRAARHRESAEHGMHWRRRGVRRFPNEDPAD